MMTYLTFTLSYSRMFLLYYNKLVAKLYSPLQYLLCTLHPNITIGASGLKPQRSVTLLPQTFAQLLPISYCPS
jgi:hypothetical protein